MSNKKVFTIATEEYLRSLFEEHKDELRGDKGYSAYEVATNAGFEGTEQEWLESLRGADGKDGKDGEFDQTTIFEILETEDKTVVGAINEVFHKISNWMEPVFDIKAQMYYGVIDPTNTGVITTFNQITLEMLDNEPGVKSVIPDERFSWSIGYVDEGSYIIVAVPAMYDFEVTKDDGFGGKIEFDESIIGANGIDAQFENTDYRLYGEFVLVSGERIIHIEKSKVVEPPPTEGGNTGNTGGPCNPDNCTCDHSCDCEDLSLDEIADVMSEVFKNPEE